MSFFRTLTFLYCFIFVSYVPALAQSDNSKLKSDTTVNIYGDIGDEGREYNITILKRNGRTHITYVVNNSIDKSGMEADKDYEHLEKLYFKGKRIKDAEARKYLDMFKRYQTNLTDSISFPEDTGASFNTLIRTIAQKDLKELTNGDRIGFDGFNVNFRVKVSKKVQEVSVHCPNAKFEPLLTELISQTISIYRTFKNQNLLDRTSIKDY